MKHYYIKSHFVLRLLLCAVLFCPLAAFAQTETPKLTPVIYLEENSDGTTYTATFKALDKTPAYVKSGAGYYSLDLAEYKIPYATYRSSITHVIIDKSMKDLKLTSTAGWFYKWGG